MGLQVRQHFCLNPTTLQVTTAGQHLNITTQHSTGTPQHAPGCQKARICVPEGWSLHMNGVKRGTPGGALPALTPTEMALMPRDTNTGMEARVRPGTSRCTAQHMPHAARHKAWFPWGAM